ncbi:MAG: diguanylate cyclase domain-containing protein, partial [Pseudomonas sp.]
MSAATRTLRLLLIEDDEDDFLIIRDLLRQAKQLSCELEWISDYEQALAAIERQAHDLLLIDYYLGAESGLGLIEHARSSGVRVPIILLTGQGDDALDSSAIEWGASDYLVKGQFDSRLLARSIRYALDRAQVVAELAANETRYRQLLTDNRDAVLVVDADGTVHYANPAAEALLHAPLESLMDRRFELPQEQEGLCEWSIPIGADGQAEVEIQCAQTEWEGQAMRLLSLRDIRQRKAAEKQLRLLQRSLEACYNGVTIVDAQAADLPLIYVNPAFERITGYSAAEALGRNARFLQGEELDQAGIAEIHRSLIDKREAHVVLRNFRKDGSPFWNDLYIAPVPDEQGQISHFIGVQNDISEQKRFESELAYNASHDVLTGLPNRTLLEDRLKQGCQISRRYQRSLALMFIDLDGFKPINDSMGHSVGDQILVEVARRMNQQVRPGDSVARLGGDEFIVVLPDLARE